VTQKPLEVSSYPVSSSNSWRFVRLNLNLVFHCSESAKIGCEEKLKTKLE